MISNVFSPHYFWPFKFMKRLPYWFSMSSSLWVSLVFHLTFHLLLKFLKVLPSLTVIIFVGTYRSCWLDSLALRLRSVEFLRSKSFLSLLKIILGKLIGTTLWIYCLETIFVELWVTFVTGLHLLFRLYDMLFTFEIWTHTLWNIFPNVLPCLCLSVSFVSCILSTKSDTIPSATTDCHTSTYGCCYDGVTAAGGTHGEGCLNTPTNSKSQYRLQSI